MNRLRSLWLMLSGSLWFLPSLMLCASVIAGIELVELQLTLDADLASRWPRLFGAGAEGARGMLSAIATSMITVAGVVFSITVVALSMAASQYSPRVLRNFMSDRATQWVLGAFVSIFAYCLVVLPTIRNPDEGDFVPSLAVLGGLALAFVGVFLLIYFVHHVATTIQVSSILERISGETQGAIERLFPETFGTPAREDGNGGHRATRASPSTWTALMARSTGYLLSVEGERLMELAREHSLVIEVVPHVGDFVIKDLPMLRVGGAGRCSPEDEEALAGCFIIGRQRTVHQDAPFGLQQIVDVAMKALSPGVNDPTTAVSCIDHLGALMALMATREVPEPYRADDGVVRVIAHGPDFQSMLSLSFDAATEHAADHAEVYERLAVVIGHIAEATADPARRAALSRQAQIVIDCARRGDLAPHRLAALEGLCAAVRAQIDGERPAHPRARPGPGQATRLPDRAP